MNDSVSLIKQENLNNNNKVNNDIKTNNKKDDEKKKVTLINPNKNKENKIIQKDKEKENRPDILTDSEYKNSHARNNKTFFMKEDSNNIEIKNEEKLNLTKKIILDLYNKIRYLRNNFINNDNNKDKTPPNTKKENSFDSYLKYRKNEIHIYQKNLAFHIYF